MGNISFINYNGIPIQAERLEFQSIDSGELNLFVPSEGKVLSLKLANIEVYKIPVQSTAGEPFSYVIQLRSTLEVLDRKV